MRKSEIVLKYECPYCSSKEGQEVEYEDELRVVVCQKCDEVFVIHPVEPDKVEVLHLVNKDKFQAILKIKGVKEILNS